MIAYLLLLGLIILTIILYKKNNKTCNMNCQTCLLRKEHEK